MTKYKLGLYFNERTFELMELGYDEIFKDFYFQFRDEASANFYMRFENEIILSTFTFIGGV